MMKSYKEKRTSYEGFERWIGNFRLNLSMHSKILMLLIFLHFLVFFVFLSMSTRYETHAAIKYYTAKLIAPIMPYKGLQFTNPNGSIVISNAKTLSRTPWLRDLSAQEFYRMRRLFIYCILIYVLYPFLLKYLKSQSARDSGKRYVRGSKFITIKEYRKTARKKRLPLDLPFGSLSMPVNSEQKHCFIVGRPGVGKTVALSQILERLQERGEKIIVYDQKGDFLSKFYDEDTDLIFNPLDQRSVGWRLFNEIETIMDIDAMATTLIPENEKSGGEQFWRDTPRGLFVGILKYLNATNQRSNEDLWKTLNLDADEMRDRLKETEGAEPSARLIKNPDSKTTDSVLSILMQSTKCIEYMVKCDGKFKVLDWLEKDSGGTIFITNYADIKDTLKPILSLFIDVLGRRLLSMPDSHERRVFFLLDEFGTLQQLTTILQLLTLSRSKGGCLFLGIQDYGQIDKIYGKEHRHSIVNACGNSVTFSVKAESASDASDALGDIVFMETEETISMGGKTKNRNLSQRKKKEALVLPSELDSLPDLTAIVKFNNFHHTISQWQYKSYEDACPSFLMRDDLKLVQPDTKKDEEIPIPPKETKEASDSKKETAKEELKERQLEEDTTKGEAEETVSKKKRNVGLEV